MATSEIVTIPARRGMAARVAAGQRIRVINTHGSQVVDTWAFSARDATEWMSMEASRAWFLRLAAAVGDTFVTNQRRPILTLLEDTSGGAHDTLIAACEPPATACSASRAITTTAATTCTRRSRRSASPSRPRRHRSTCS